MSKKKFLLLLISCCILAGIVSSRIYSTFPSPTYFDNLITPAFVNSGCKNTLPYTLTCIDNIYELEYRIDFELDTTEPDLYSLMIIKIRPAWFITRRFSMFISPYGGGDMTSTTTSDNKYDIIVEQHNRGMEGVLSPEVSTEKIARELDRLYSHQ